MVEEELEIPDVPAQAAETFLKRWQHLEDVFILVHKSCMMLQVFYFVLFIIITIIIIIIIIIVLFHSCKPHCILKRQIENFS